MEAMNAFGKTVCAVGALIAVMAILVVGFLVALYLSTTSHVMTKTSPDGGHTAKLVRSQGIDVNFDLSVDGDRVYWSPDFAPEKADFRERIAWDESGQSVVLEVGGERLFGYSATEKRPLTDTELLKIAFTPFSALGYEDTLPKQNSAE